MNKKNKTDLVNRERSHSHPPLSLHVSLLVVLERGPLVLHNHTPSCYSV